MRDFYVFDIPIYRCKEDRYKAELANYVEKHLQACFDSHGTPRPPDSDHQIIGIKDRSQIRFGGPWRFNQVIGWLRLFVEGNGLGGHLWMAEGKNMTRRMKKVYRQRSMSNALTSHVLRQADSSAIYRQTLESIKTLAKHKHLATRVFDLSMFERIGPFVDWVGLIDEGHTRNSERYRERAKRLDLDTPPDLTT